MVIPIFKGQEIIISVRYNPQVVLKRRIVITTIYRIITQQSADLILP
jgi:hypothetical protein